MYSLSFFRNTIFVYLFGAILSLAQAGTPGNSVLEKNNDSVYIPKGSNVQVSIHSKSAGAQQVRIKDSSGAVVYDEQISRYSGTDTVYNDKGHHVTGKVGAFTVSSGGFFTIEFLHPYGGTLNRYMKSTANFVPEGKYGLRGTVHLYKGEDWRDNDYNDLNVSLWIDATAGI
ncbi:hypothetical protein [Endozoicomonas sp. SCSIO W0465]|uniref:hypothetical protein n=1 Tax=Endozoicomonas sp. SCSIO W0465 TaxID=2918516 RepID=UPI0020760351|nr:hypothetical protein [Endozoicomonas sp. SCSIO W0465]USE38088.1 hypothetical protein MJO57_07895 [Endozoicomonas sp. SCSIO W0465]